MNEDEKITAFGIGIPIGSWGRAQNDKSFN